MVFGSLVNTKCSIRYYLLPYLFSSLFLTSILNEKINRKIVYFFRLEIMNANAIMDDAAINNEYARNSGIGVGVGVGDGDGG